MEEKRDFRPKLHFTAPKNWLNDPNGLVRTGDTYHLFYQHNVKEPRWGPMHWGHAVSRDLYHWEHRDVALYPDKLGMIFSGSAVLDEENVSGLGCGGRTPLLAFFTYDDGKTEFQSMAFSLDEGQTFHKTGTPLIENPGIHDFRDPKVIRVGDRWVMAVAVWNQCWFYASKNLLDWEKTGEFGPLPEEIAPAGAVWECPDLYPLTGPDGETHWVLVINLQIPPEKGGVRPLYWLGQFENGTFTAQEDFCEPLDCGFDCYAATTYFNAPQRTMIAWGDNMVYAGEAPTGEWRCHMTMPRVLSLKDTPKGLRLASLPLVPEEARGKAEELEKKSGEKSGALPGKTFVLRVTGTGEGSVTLKNGRGNAFSFGVNADNAFFIDRRNTCAPFCESYSEHLMEHTAPRFFEGSWQLDAVLDGCAFEMFGDGGTRAFSVSLFPENPFDAFETAGNLSVQILPL